MSVHRSCLESAIFTGLKTMIPGLRRLIYVHHLMKQDELKLSDLPPKTGRNIADRKLSSPEIIKDIYGSRVANFYKYGIAESIDPVNFNAKLDSPENHFVQDFTNGSFEIESLCSWKASSNLQGSIQILRVFIIKMI